MAWATTRIQKKTLSMKGNGNYAYIDNITEAKSVGK